MGEVLEALFKGVPVEPAFIRVHFELEVALFEVNRDFALQKHVRGFGVVSEAFEVEVVGAIDGVDQLRVNPVREDQQNVVNREHAQRTHQKNEEASGVVEGTESQRKRTFPGQKRTRRTRSKRRRSERR